MIEVQELTKSYGDRKAIDHLNFSIQKGEVVGFLGPNGAGKSTTMKIITGFMAPTSGIAKIAGIDVFENPIEVKKRIGYLPETPPVYSDMYVRDYLNYVAELKRVAPGKINQNINRAIEKTQLGDVQNRLIGHLSKGFKQRVGIAQALVSDPEVLILDEPTVGLDPKQVSEIRDLINELKGQYTVILSTHILSEVEATCEKVIIIHQGKIVAQDSIQDLAKYSKNAVEVFVRTKKPIVMTDQLANLTGILKVEPGSDQSQWKIQIQGGDEALENLSGLIYKAGCGLLEFSPHKVSLEDVFLKLTYGQEGGI